MEYTFQISKSQEPTKQLFRSIQVQYILVSKRDDILQATLELIVEHGLQSVSFTKIFAKAGVGAGTIYNYFSSKEELVNTVYQETADLLENHIMANHDPESSIEVQLKSFIRNMAKFALQYPKQLELISACKHSPYVSAILRQRTTPSVEITMRLIAEAQAQGIMSNIDPRVAVHLSSGAILAVVQASISGYFSLDDVIIEQVIEACWKAFAQD